jgi:hypothetical protein
VKGAVRAAAPVEVMDTEPDETTES